MKAFGFPLLATTLSAILLMSPQAPAQQTGPVAEFAEVNFQRVGSVLVVSGRVKNLTDKELVDVRSNVYWLSAPTPENPRDPAVLKFAMGEIEPLPLAPGQVGAFEIRDVYNPKYADFKLFLSRRDSTPVASRIASPTTQKRDRPVELEVSGVS